jgi:hypothetical protein
MSTGQASRSPRQLDRDRPSAGDKQEVQWPSASCEA